eukprot:UN05356
MSWTRPLSSVTKMTMRLFLQDTVLVERLRQWQPWLSAKQSQQCSCLGCLQLLLVVVLSLTKNKYYHWDR